MRPDSRTAPYSLKPTDELLASLDAEADRSLTSSQVHTLDKFFGPALQTSFDGDGEVLYKLEFRCCGIDKWVVSEALVSRV